MDENQIAGLIVHAALSEKRRIEHEENRRSIKRWERMKELGIGIMDHAKYLENYNYIVDGRDHNMTMEGITS